jgi:predicted transcriptional regulator
MTEHTEDGWPEKYRDPRDRPHPETVRVTVENFEAVREETLTAARDIDDGETRPAIVSFQSVDDLRKVLTKRRVELLHTLLGRGTAAESITALAETLGRGYRPVHEDVTLLVEYGLLFLIEEGQTKRPYLPYERIHIDIEIAGKSEGTEDVPA